MGGFDRGKFVGGEVGGFDGGKVVSGEVGLLVSIKIDPLMSEGGWFCKGEEGSDCQG